MSGVAVLVEAWSVKEVRYAPERGQLEPGVLYHSLKFGFIQHLCACGCGIVVHVPTTGPGDNWRLSGTPDAPTAQGSFFHRFYCRAHYSIVDGRTVWHLHPSERGLN